MSVWWLVVFAAMFLIGLTKSGFGSGVGLMIVPMTVVAMGHTRYGSPAALGMMLPLLVAGDVMAVWQYRRISSLPTIAPLLPGTLCGVAVGGVLLWWFHQQAAPLIAPLIKLEVAIESIGLVGLHWWRVWRRQHLHITPSPTRSTVVGAAAGVSSTVAHAAGPIIALYLLPQRLDRQRFVGACAVYFFLINLVKTPVYAYNAMFDGGLLMLGLKLFPLVAAGAVCGFWINRRMNDALFSRVVYALTFALGWYLLYDGARGLGRV